MTTLREAAQMALNDLEALVAYIKGSEPDLVMQVPSIEALRAALATEQEQEQEPYCYTWDVWISGGYWEARYGWEPYCGGKRPAHSTEAKPLYTAPPQREWQGLTDEDSEDACWTEVDQRLCSFARAIEAALRSKNT